MGDSGAGKPRRFLGRILPRVAGYLAISMSLLAFPSALPWVLVGWIALGAVRLLGGKPAWPVLLLAVVIVLIKRVDWAPGLVALVLLMLAASGVDAWFRGRRKRSLGKAAWGMVAILAMAWILMAWDWTRAMSAPVRERALDGRPVVCIGDSLSADGYPRELAARLRVPVIDLARGGITSAQGLERLPDLERHRPLAVILEIGGHDFIKGASRAETRENLEQYIRKARQLDAELILFEIPRGFVIDPYAGLERELGRQYDLEVIPDTAIRNLVIWSPLNPVGSWFREPLSYDGLHPNEAGNRYLADWAVEALVRLYGTGILK